ncbi:MAG TPA: protease pro-enzyme activation domain-containing protein, partial [Jatrophihabitans sp.]|nr:protease pro-enzyme activation domain-containing protein [Jatrophihabitans sp.]
MSLALLLASATGVAFTLPVAAQADTPSLFTVTQNVLPGLAHATDLGPAADSTPMSLVVTVHRPDVAGEKALLAAEHDPSSPSYRHFLTPSQFAQRFGVPAGQRSAVSGYLTGGGLRVDSVSVAGDEYSVRGSAAQVASVFRTSFHTYRYGSTT